MKVIKMGSRQDNGKVVNFEAEGNSTFYVRFFVDELESEFVEMVEMFNRHKMQLLVTKEVANMYKVTSPIKYDPEDMDCRPWDIVMHKYSAMSHSVRVDKESGKKYYPIRFSASYIKEETPITA